MIHIRYVTLNPTGNITCLVLDPVPESERNRVTAALMDRCEQVGYLTEPAFAAASARLQMMGGEFCGNATMATAAYLALRDGAGEKRTVPLEVSGAEGILPCAVQPMPDGSWEGTVDMPPVLEIKPFKILEYGMSLVRLQGIAHLILPDHPLDRRTAERLLLSAASDLPDPSAGLLQWDSRTKYMKPLVFVKKSDTLVWETGCGSGSTAVGAWLASSNRDGAFRTDIEQPGGIIRVNGWKTDGRIVRIQITGKVRIGKTEYLDLEDQS